MQTNHLSFSLSIVIMMAAVVSFLTVIIFNFLYAHKKRKKIHFDKLELLALQHEKNILAAKIEMKETAEQRISSAVHNNIFLSLALGKLYLNTIPWEQPDTIKIYVGNAIDALTKSIADLCDVTRSLNWNVLDREGLVNALEQETERMRGTRLFVIDYEISGEADYLSSEKELILFRMVQESFANIIKHSGAEHISLRLDYTPDHLTIRVEDNGKGFSINEIADKQGSGLRNIKARVELMGGEMQVKSELGNGVVVQVRVPI
jgi:signal transduction histidine kinase